VTVTDDSDLIRSKIKLLVSGIQNHIIVAQGVILVKSHLVELPNIQPMTRQLGASAVSKAGGRRRGLDDHL